MYVNTTLGSFSTQKMFLIAYSYISQLFLITVCLILQGCQVSRFGRETHGYLPVLAQSHDGSYFSHGFLHGSHSSFRSNASVIQKLFWLSCFILNTSHFTALFALRTPPGPQFHNYYFSKLGNLAIKLFCSMS